MISSCFNQEASACIFKHVIVPEVILLTVFTGNWALQIPLNFTRGR
jgi:hypothetical protein